MWWWLFCFFYQLQDEFLESVVERDTFLFESVDYTGVSSVEEDGAEGVVKGDFVGEKGT